MVESELLPETNNGHAELPQTPGWALMSRTKQAWLLDHTEKILRYRCAEGLAAVGACLELAEVEKGLTGEAMTMSDYMRTVYGQSIRTAWRRLADFKELRRYWPDDVIKLVAARGGALLRGASGVGMKDLINVAKAIPAPNSKETAIIEAYIERDVRGGIARDRRSRSRDRLALQLSEEVAAKTAFNFLRRIMRIVEFESNANRRKWLTRVVGWTLEDQTVPGVVKIGRIPLPEDAIIRRGRPRKGLRLPVQKNRDIADKNAAERTRALCGRL